VVCEVREVKDFGAFVTLEEYPGKEGFIHISEVAPGWVKYIRKFIREKQKVVCKVLRVNPSRGQIDLSLKQVNPHQKREAIQRWKNEQKAEKLFSLFAEKMNLSFDEAYEKYGKRLVEVFGSFYRAFEETVLNPDVLEEEGFKGSWTKTFKEIAETSIQIPFVTVSANLKLWSFETEGINHIKDALIKAKNNDQSIRIIYAGAPIYKLKIVAMDYAEAEKKLKKASERAISYIKSKGGFGEFYREDKDASSS
ncbi:MAG TPA: translation initiation factor IF-2 subunit alpha, partial [Thermoplasmata archaeon]|nr:translation initiation factor IF-2 subunit alpha [Thermoplasmata archaeon]